MRLTSLKNEIQPNTYAPKTLWRMRSKLIDNWLEDLLFECITRKLVQVFTIDTDKQRIDSVHIKSNMHRLRRIGDPQVHKEPEKTTFVIV